MTDHYCPQCGSPLEENARFCANCGAEVTEEPPRTMSGTSVLLGAGVILLLISTGIVVLLLYAGDQSASAPPPEQAVGEIPAGVERILADEAYALVERGEAVLVDVRSRAAFAEAHAEGALSLPEDEVAQRATELPQDQLIITYCT